MSRPDLRGYHRALTLYALNHASTTSTAADLAEVMTTFAMGDGQPKAMWADITPASVAGYLKALENDGEAIRAGERRNTRSGRMEPVWTIAAARLPDMALPNPAAYEEDPAPGVPDRAVNESRYSQLDRSQLYELLNVHDAISGACTRFLREIDDITEKARIRLTAAGLDVPEKLG